MLEASLLELHLALGAELGEVLEASSNGNLTFHNGVFIMHELIQGHWGSVHPGTENSSYVLLQPKVLSFL